MLSSKERDAETGLDFFGARYMSSAQGRFTTVDPVFATASLFNPQSWNGYAYTLNNPLKYVDDDGHFPILAITAAGGQWQVESSVQPENIETRFGSLVTLRAVDGFGQRLGVESWQVVWQG